MRKSRPEVLDLGPLHLELCIFDSQCFTFLDARFQKGLPTNPPLPLRVAALTQAFLESCCGAVLGPWGGLVPGPTVLTSSLRGPSTFRPLFQSGSEQRRFWNFLGTRNPCWMGELGLWRQTGTPAPGGCRATDRCVLSIGSRCISALRPDDSMPGSGLEIPKVLGFVSWADLPPGQCSLHGRSPGSWRALEQLLPR